MFSPNFLVVGLAALIPMIIGAIYYSPAVMEKAWMRESGTTKEQVESGNMLVIMGVSLLFSAMISMAMCGFSNHQLGLASVFQGDKEFENKDSEVYKHYENFVNGHEVATRHRGFRHGAVHGAIAAIFIVLPLIGIISLFERRSFKYIGIQFLYWLIVLILMCGVHSQWGMNPPIG